MSESTGPEDGEVLLTLPQRSYHTLPSALEPGINRAGGHRLRMSCVPGKLVVGLAKTAAPLRAQCKPGLPVIVQVLGCQLGPYNYVLAAA